MTCTLCVIVQVLVVVMQPIQKKYGNDVARRQVPTCESDYQIFAESVGKLYNISVAEVKKRFMNHIQVLYKYLEYDMG